MMLFMFGQLTTNISSIQKQTRVDVILPIHDRITHFGKNHVEYTSSAPSFQIFTLCGKFEANTDNIFC